MIKLSDYIMQYIANSGVKHVFMLSGGGCMHLVDSIGRNSDLNYVCCSHEQVASFAATAYSQYTKNLGVALVTTGPGGTNALTGVAAAWADSIPVLVLSGQVKRSDMSGDTGVRMLGFQEIDIVSIVNSVTKYAVTILEPRKIKYHLEKAYLIARAGRPGPVWLDIPLDVQASMIDENKLPSFNEEEYLSSANVFDSENDLASKISEIIEMINNSQRPAIIAGYGIKITNSEDNFIELIKKIGIPVLTTWKALDLLPEDFDLFFGRPGCIGQRGANFIQQNSDLIISLGARLDYGQIGYSHETFAREAKKVVIDVDKSEPNKFKFKIDVNVNISADIFIKEFLKQINKLNSPCPLLTERENGNSYTIKSKKFDRTSWVKRCKEWKDKYPVILPEHWDKKDFVSTYALIDVISNISEENDLFVPENSGAASEIVMQALRLKKSQRVITTNSLGSMGSGLPASIGACIASEKKRTICINGDGGFQMNIQDLETVVRLKLPIKYFILNNDGYGSIRNMQRNYFNGFYVASGHLSGVTIPDMKKIAYAYGINYIVISKNSEIKKKVKESLAFDGPVICDVLVDPAEQTMPKLSSHVKPDGSMVSKPLEDLWPFLDRKEFKANMIVKPVEE